MQKYLLTFLVGSLIFVNGWGQSVNPQLLWSTYFGSPGDDYTGYVITDKEDNIYMTSTVENGAPTTAGVHQVTYGGGVSDVMLSKFDKNGNLIWSTYFGGLGRDETVFPVSLMSDGSVVLTGNTTSTNRIASSGAHDVSFGGGTSDVFLAVFESNGKLRWATYFGGTGFDGEAAPAIDDDDNIYITGVTSSTTGIATDSSFQSTNKGNQDGFLSKFDKTGKLLWSTYYGGQANEAFYAVAVDKDKNVYVGGESNSSQLATAGSFKVNYGGNGDGFMAKFSNDGERLWATYFGSGGSEGIYFLALDGNNDIICVGPSNSTGGIASPGAFEEKNSGKNDVFISKFNANGQRLWSTFYGGEEWDTAFGCDFDSDHNIYVSIMSQSEGLPITENVPGMYYNGGAWDAAFVKFSKDGELKWSTYLGGDGNDRAIGITLDSEQNIIASINSDSKGLATHGAYNEIARGNESLLIKMKDATTVNVDEIHTLSKIQCFPNPTSDKIEILNPLAINRNITIFDANGAMVLRHINTYQSQFNVRNLPPGIYYILLDENLLISSGKFLKVE